MFCQPAWPAATFISVAASFTQACLSGLLWGWGSSGWCLGLGFVSSSWGRLFASSGGSLQPSGTLKVCLWVFFPLSAWRLLSF